MRHKGVLFFVIIMLSLGTASLRAQEATVPSGGNASGSGGSISYSVGQVVYSANKGANGSELQGVQQPYEITVLTGIKEAIDIELSASVYPNPTTDFLTLKIKNNNFQNLTYQLFNSVGKLVNNSKVWGNETQINMSNLVAETYFLKVVQDKSEIKTFKIIKQ